MALRLLIVEGNIREDREAYLAEFGMTASQSYAATLTAMAGDALCEICTPADAGANLPGGDGLEAYDGVFVTGSALNVYDGGPAIDRQIELARAVFASRTPFFGSCWGLQLVCAAAGGEVTRNPRGREIGIARNISPTEAGRTHPLLAGRPRAYDAPCSHIDHVAVPPPDATVLASNAMSEVQAAEIRYAGATFWGVQYHPEYSLGEIAPIVARRAPALTREGLFAGVDEALSYAGDLKNLDAAPDRRDLAFRLGIGEDVLEPARRRLELSNFLETWVRPFKSARGRA